MYHINKRSCKNPYDLPKDQYVKLIDIIDIYLSKMSNVKSTDMSLSELLAYFMIIGEAYPLLNDKDRWDDISYNLIKQIRNYIIIEKYNSVSLYGGLSNIGMAVNIMVKNSGHYNKFLISINELLINMVNDRLKYIFKKGDSLSTIYYDTILGMSGVCEYLLQLDDEKVEDTIKKILIYLVSIANKKEYGERLIPGWYTNGENQVSEEYKKDYPNGSINFSLSHGIAGPLKVLVSAYKKGIYVTGHLQAIHTILDEYKKVGYINKDYATYMWPGILSIDDYLLGNYYSRPNNRMSWCYGSVGILRCMYLTAITINNLEMMDFTIEEYQRISELDIQDFLLESPILCHGYAGTMALLQVMFNDTGNIKIKHQCISLLKKVIDCFNQEYKYGFQDLTWEKENGKYIPTSKDKNDFLEGAGGIILELLSFLKEDIEFDKLLLIRL